MKAILLLFWLPLLTSATALAQKTDSLYAQWSLIRQEKPNGSTEEAATLVALGRALHQQSNHDEAIAAYEKALALQQQLLPANHPDITYTQYLIGWAFLGKSAYNEAIDWLEKAAQRYLETKDEASTEYVDVLEKRTQAYLYNGRYTDALADAQHLLELRLAAQPPNYAAIAKAYGVLGTQYKYLKKYPESIRYYEEALTIYNRAEKKNFNAMAACLSEIGQIYLYQKDYARALATFQQEDSMMISSGEHLKMDYAYTCSDFGKFYLATGQYDKSLQWQQKSVDIIQQFSKSDNTNAATLHLYLGRAQSAMNQFPEAIASFETNAGMLSRIYGPNSYREFHNHAELGYTYLRWYSQMHDPELLQKSRHFFRRFESDIDYQMQTDQLPEAQQKLRSESLRYFERAILAELEVPEDDPEYAAAQEKAWQLSEKMHNYMLLAATMDARAKHFSGIPEEALEQDRALNRKWTNLDKKRLYLVNGEKRPPTDSTVIVLDAQIAAAKAAQSRLWRSFEEQYPEYHQLKYKLQQASIAEVQQRLNVGQTLLEYFVGDSTLYLFELTQTSCRIHTIAGTGTLQAIVDNFQKGLTDYHTSAALNSQLYRSSVMRYAAAAQQLYQILWLPVAQSAGTEIILVPGEYLSNLPFEALLSAAPSDPGSFTTYPFLLKKHFFQYAYSATMWLEMQDRKHRETPANNLLALAPFCFSEATASLSDDRNKSNAYGNWSPLAFSDEEITSITKLIPEHSTRLLGAEANKTQFLQLAAQYRILHLATHGKANPGAGDQCYLAFASTTSGTDALLTAAKLYNLPINADLVVLSACETGIGEQLRGEGVLSLARAFAYAGAKSIVASLWRVNDQSTMQIMEAFYAGIKAGKPKHIALGEAKRQYLKQNPGNNAHPFFWAAFVGLGDTGAIY